MLRLSHLSGIGLDLACRLLPNLFLNGRLLPTRRRRCRPARRTRLELEALEDRTLLSASIFGSVFNDLSGSGSRDAGDPGLAARIVYLDLNRDGRLDSISTTLDATTTGISGSGPGNFGTLLAEVGGVGTPLTVQGQPANFQNVVLTLDLTNNSPDPIPVTLVSPLGETIPNLPLLFTIMPGQHFVGAFDGNSTNQVTLTPGYPNSLVPNGTYAPQQAFTDPQYGIDNSGTNGVWGLVFFGPPSAFSGSNSLVVNSWSLSFTTAEPSTQTDAAGNYSFTGLAPGTYPVSLVTSAADIVTLPSVGNSQTVTVADGQALHDVDFGVEPAPDLTTTSFSLSAPATAWGQQVTVNYVVTNQGDGNAPAFNVGLYLSADGTISSTGTPLDTIPFAFGLAAGQSVSGSVTVTLPMGDAPGSPPPGFGSTSTAYIGFVVDPTNTIQESAANQSNQGAGIDLALLGPKVNTAVTDDSSVQQSPSIAVDPSNPQHLVTAYLDYSLLGTGYAGIGVAVSNDGGASWLHSSIPMPAGFGQGAAAPSVVFDAQGDVFVSFMAATYLGAQPDLTNPASSQRAFGFLADNGIFVAKSTDGGLSWNTPVAVVEQQPSQTSSALAVAAGSATVTPATMVSSIVAGTRLLIDQGQPNQETVTVTAVTATTFTATFANAHSAGFTITAPVPYEAFPSLAIDTETGSPYFGRLYVTYSQFYPAGQFPNDPNSASGSDVMIAVSLDGGVSWATQMQNLSPSFYDTPVPSGAGAGLVSALKEPNQGNNDTGTAGKGSEEFSTVSVGAGGTVYVAAYAAGFFAVYVSQDGGLSTGTPGTLVSGFTEPNYFNQTGYPFFSAGNLVVTDSTLTTYANSNLNSPEPPTFDNFRTLPLRQIVADPTRPGVVYALAASALDQAQVLAPGQLDGVDAAGVVLAVSTDYGQTWYSNYTVGSETTSALLASVPVGNLTSWLPVLNDENNGVYGGFTLNGQGQVDGGQALPTMTVNAQGDVVVVWYDTRSDPNGQNLEVWGTVSTDGGQHFSSNFQVSNASFDPNAGAFTAANGNTSYYLGDQIGVAAAGNTAYAVWTDTRSGSQEIEFGSFGIQPAPQTPADRFGPNNTPQTATNLGSVTAQEIYPDLTLNPSSSDEWFQFQAGATGFLSVSVTASGSGGSSLQVEVVDAVTNAVLTPTSTTTLTDATGAIIGLELEVPSVSGHSYLIHACTDLTTVTYTLTVGTLTADLGTQVEGSRSDSVSNGGENVYRLAAGVQGTLDVSLTSQVPTGGGNLNLSILGTDGQTVLAADPSAGVGPGASEAVSIQVTQGEVVFLEVSGANLSAASGAFLLGYTNFDQYEASGLQTLFLPEQGSPTSIVADDLNGDGKPDLLTTNTTTSDTVSVLLSNGDGTFQAPQQSAVGPGLSSVLSAGNRQPVVADFNGDGIPDVAVPNFQTGTVSVLIGNGDGTFQPQRIFNGVPNGDSMVAGDFTGDGKLDLVVLQNFPPGGGGVSEFAYLQGRGDGTFLPPVFYQTDFHAGANSMATGYFTSDGHLDLVITSKNSSFAQLFFGNGDGTFRDGGLINIGEATFNVAVADLGNGHDDLITTSTNSGKVYVTLGNGDGTFQAPVSYQAMTPPAGNNVGVFGLAVTRFGNTDAKAPLNLVVTAQLRSGQGAAEVILFRGNGDGTFGTAQVLATVGTAGNIAVGDFTGGGITDLAVTDKGGVTIIYGQPLTLTATRDLGDAAHVVTVTQAIVTGHEDTSFTYTVPADSAPGSGPQVVDFSALFQYTAGAGLQMEVLDSHGNVLDTNGRFRVVAAQGAVLTVRIFGVSGTGNGAYTLDIDVLPQIVSVQANSVLPGGPVSSLTVTMQGDQLDPSAFNNVSNFTVTWLGPDGSGSADDQVIPIAAVGGGAPVVYNQAADIQVASNLRYPPTARRTINLLFANPLPAGSYQVTLGTGVQTAPYSASEAGLLVGAGFDGHPVVSVAGGTISSGATFTATGLVTLAAPFGNPDAISNGTPFLTQLQNDLGALLDTQVKAVGDAPAVTTAINDQILSRFVPAFDAALAAGDQGNGPLTFAIIWLDPVSCDLQSPQGQQASYNLGSNQAVNGIDRTFIEVGGNVELLVLAGQAGTFKLDVSDVPALARGGAVVLSPVGDQVMSFTDALRSGTMEFNNQIPTQAVTGVLDPPAQGGGLASGAVAALGSTMTGSGTANQAGGSSGENALSKAATNAAAEALVLASVTSSVAEVARPVLNSTVSAEGEGVRGAAGLAGGLGLSGGGDDGDSADPNQREVNRILRELMQWLLEHTNQFLGAADPPAPQDATVFVVWADEPELPDVFAAPEEASTAVVPADIPFAPTPRQQALEAELPPPEEVNDAVFQVAAAETPLSVTVESDGRTTEASGGEEGAAPSAWGLTVALADSRAGQRG